MELGFSNLFTSYDMELETHLHVQIEKQLGFHDPPNWKPTRVSWTTSYEMELETHVHVQIEKQLGFHELPNCMLSLELTSYDMELGFSDFFKSYEMELETHVHGQIGKQLGFHELQIACYH